MPLFLALHMEKIRRTVLHVFFQNTDKKHGKKEESDRWKGAESRIQMPV